MRLIKIKPRFKKKHIKSLNGSKGTFIIFHDEMLHGGNILKNSCCRVSIEFTFLIYKKKYLILIIKLFYL